MLLFHPISCPDANPEPGQAAAGSAYGESWPPMCIGTSGAGYGRHMTFCSRAFGIALLSASPAIQPAEDDSPTAYDGPGVMACDGSFIYRASSQHDRTRRKSYKHKFQLPTFHLGRKVFVLRRLNGWRPHAGHRRDRYGGIVLSLRSLIDGAATRYGRR